MKAIMYHYVRMPEKNLPHFKYLHYEDFVNQLDFFESEYGFVEREAFFNAVQTGIPARGVVLTFDDGLKDHYRFVLPELKRRNLWACFFVCTGIYATHKLLNVHRIHMLIGSFGGETIFKALKNIVRQDMLTDADKKEFAEIYTEQQNDEYTALVKKWLNYYIDYAYRDIVLDELMQVFFGNEHELANDFYLSGDELKIMQDEGMVIGSHTVTHPLMSKLDVEGQQWEISESFNALDGLTGGLPVKTFCYPYGGFRSFTADTERILDDNGAVCSFNYESRDIGEADLVRKQALPRFDCNEFKYGQVRIV